VRADAGLARRGGVIEGLRESMSAGLDVEAMVKRVRNPKRVAGIVCIVVLSLALFIRMQRRMDQVGTMDATKRVF